MTDSRADISVSPPKNRARYLRLIAVFKIAKGLLVLALGLSILFLNSRTALLDRVGDWAGDELLLEHSKPVHFLLGKLQTALEGRHLRATGVLALIYSTLLCTEGLGVFFQQRWAEFLMVYATAALIPIELRHVWHRPSLPGVVVVVLNCVVVWYLYRVLRRAPDEARAKAEPEVAALR